MPEFEQGTILPQVSTQVEAKDETAAQMRPCLPAHLLPLAVSPLRCPVLLLECVLAARVSGNRACGANFCCCGNARYSVQPRFPP